jgi:hypothetical protein
MNRLIALAHTGLLGLIVASVSLSTGCGTDIQVGGSTGTGGNTSGSSTGVTTGTGGESSTTTGEPTTGTGGSISGTGGAGGGTTCGGFAGSPCASDEYCDYPHKNCGADDSTGTCKKRPTACDNNLILTCGCDGQNHGNPCEANAAGYDISTLGSCQAPMGQFRCGAQYCIQATTYCARQISDVVGEPDSFGCNPLPGGCGATPTCACLSGEPCGNQCVATDDGGLRLSCPGG